MSGEGGGRSDKFGNEFEKLFVISLAIKVLKGDYSSLQWEPLRDGEGIEGNFVRASGRKIVFQCKEQNGVAGKWSMSTLASRGILAIMLDQLRHSGDNDFLFVSGDACPEFRELKHRAAHCDEKVADFREKSLTTNYVEAFERLCAEWHLDHANDDDITLLFCLLQRIDFAHGFKSQHELDGLRSEIADWLHGDPVSAIATLGDILQSELGNTLSSSGLRDLLRQTDHSPRDLFNNPRIPSTIERITTEYLDRQKSLLIKKTLLNRQESREILSELFSESGARVIFVSGTAGVGKSGVMFEVVSKLRESQMPVCAFSLSDYRPEASLRTFFMSKLDLPSAPGACLRIYSSGKPAVLVIDQLDSVRWTGTHSEEAWRVCRELLDEVLCHREIRLVVVCRSYDLKSDQEIKRWQRALADPEKNPDKVAFREIEVGYIPDADVRDFLVSLGHVYDTLSEKLKHLLRLPFCLNLWWTIAIETGQSTDFTTRSNLLQEFYRQHLARIAGQKSVSISDLNATLKKISEYCDRRGQQEMSPRLLADQQHVIDALCSGGFLVPIGGNSIRFSHQLLLDFLIAQRVTQEACQDGTTPILWIRQHDQALFRREQFRQLLSLLRDVEPSLYLRTLEELFKNSDIRFHLRHLALCLLGESDSPLKGETELALSLWADQRWRRHVLENVFYGRSDWFKELKSLGLIENWLGSGEQTQIDDAITLCRGCFESLPELVIESLSPFWPDAEWRKRIAQSFPFRIYSQHSTLFKWHCALVRDGYINLDLYNLSDLAKVHPDRVVYLFGSYVSNVIRIFENWGPEASLEDNRTAVRDIRHDVYNVLSNACQAYPELTWSQLLPQLMKLIALLRSKHKRSRSSDGPVFGYHVRKSTCGWLGVLRKLLSDSAQALVTQVPAKAIDIIRRLQHRSSRTLDRVCVSLFRHLPAQDYADMCISWLVKDFRRLEIGSSRRLTRQGPAKRLLLRFSSHCSPILFQKLETTILKYHPRSERKSFEMELCHFRRGESRRNDYGLAQHVLLGGLPSKRLSAKARIRQHAWNAKFHGFKNEKAGRLRTGGMIASPIPGNRIHLVSDRQWLSIMKNSSYSMEHVRWRQLDHNTVGEANHQNFADHFRRAVENEPRRFVRLARQIPANSSEYYWTALFHGLTTTIAPENLLIERDRWTPASMEEITSLLEYLAPKFDSPHARRLCWLLYRRCEQPWSPYVLELLGNLTMSHPDPEPENPELRRQRKDEKESRDDVEMYAINCVRGSACDALAHHLLYFPEQVESCLAIIEAAAKDPHVFVRVAATKFCLPLINVNRDIAMQHLEKCLAHPDDRVLNSRNIREAIYYLWRSYPSRIEPILHRMMKSPVSACRKEAGYWITKGFALSGSFSALMQIAPSDIYFRIGKVKAGVSLTHISDLQVKGVEILDTLLNDNDDEVKERIANAFFQNELFLASEIAVKFGHRYSSSDSFKLGADTFLHSFTSVNGSILRYVDSLEMAIQRVLTSPSDLKLRRYSLAIHEIPSLLLRMYREAEGGANLDLRRRCLDLWDNLLETGDYTAKQGLKEVDG